jgi:lysophospholipase L1-like esterase
MLAANKRRRYLTRKQLLDIHKMRRKIDCPTSEIYDNEHHAHFGNGCGYRHRLYSWAARGENDVTLISDSICKWVNKMPRTHTQGIPGLTLETALHHLQKKTLIIKPFKVIILHIGTNNVWSDTPQEFKRKLVELIEYIRKNSSVQRIGLSSILPRVRDLSHPNIEMRRRELNTVMCKLCVRKVDMLYMRSWKAVTVGNQTDRACYARDGLHLNFEGIIRMRRYIRGASGNLLDLNRPRAQPPM